MQVSYGPPGQRGVTHLMAVGADDVEPAASDTLLRGGIAAAAVAIGAGVVLGSRTVKTGAAGALVALLLVRAIAKKPRVVEVTQPATSGWRW